MSSAFSHPWLGAWMGDAQIAATLSAENDLSRMLEVEIAWIEAQSESSTIDAGLAVSAVDHIKNCHIEIADLSAGVMQDGLPIPQLVRSLKKDAAADVREIIHTGLTSQDVLDTAMCLALREVFALFKARLNRCIRTLYLLENDHGSNALMGYTRMQAALPITAGTRIATWRRPLEKYLQQLAEAEGRLNTIQFGGPVGERGIYQGNGTIAAFAQKLGLRDPGHAWHTDRSDLVTFCAALSHIANTLGKFGQDVVLMAQTGREAIELSGGGSSSAMPHKQNPIKGELLVALARHCAALQGSMVSTLVHEQERSGAAWTLEMMTQSDLIQTCGRSLTVTQELLEQIKKIGY